MVMDVVQSTEYSMPKEKFKCYLFGLGVETTDRHADTIFSFPHEKFSSQNGSAAQVHN